MREVKTRENDFRYVRFAFALFALISLIVVGVEGWRHDIGLGTLAVRAAIVIVGIRIICAIVVGVLRSYEEIQGN